MGIKDLALKLTARYWSIGFVYKGLDGIMNDNPINVEWLRMPKDGWFADPFILDVCDNEIQVLVEEKMVGSNKGVITLLKIDRQSMELKSKKIVLEQKFHLSFPCILRKDGKIYIYPESASSGKIDMYEYNPRDETASYLKTICDNVVWDSCITELFGEKLLFTAAHSDFILDIYKWNDSVCRFLPWKQVISDNKNSRMGGQLFEYKGEIYYPAQDCNKNYGSAIQIKRVRFNNNTFSCEVMKRIISPHPKMTLGLHTINEYKGVVVVDVYGYRHPLLGKVVDCILGIKKQTFAKTK